MCNHPLPTRSRQDTIKRKCHHTKLDDGKIKCCAVHFYFRQRRVNGRTLPRRSTRFSHPKTRGFHPLLARLPKRAKVLKNGGSRTPPMDGRRNQRFRCSGVVHLAWAPWALFLQHGDPCFGQNPEKELFLVNSRVSRLNQGSSSSWEAGLLEDSAPVLQQNSENTTRGFTSWTRSDERNIKCCADIFIFVADKKQNVGENKNVSRHFIFPTTNFYFSAIQLLFSLAEKIKCHSTFLFSVVTKIKCHSTFLFSVDDVTSR